MSLVVVHAVGLACRGARGNAQAMLGACGGVWGLARSGPALGPVSGGGQAAPHLCGGGRLREGRGYDIGIDGIRVTRWAAAAFPALFSLFSPPSFPSFPPDFSISMSKTAYGNMFRGGRESGIWSFPGGV